MAAVTISAILLISGSAWAGNESTSNTRYGLATEDPWGAASVDNTIIGPYAGIDVGVGSGIIGASDNTFVGAYSGHDSSTGYSNSFVGANSGESNTTGNSNSYFGRAAGHVCTTGARNSAFGFYAGYYNETGNGNVFIGYMAGMYVNGSNKLYIDNCYTEGFCDKPLIYGEFDNRIVKINGTLMMTAVLSPSDLRLKKDIEPLKSSLEKVGSLTGVSYVWRVEENPGRGFNNGRNIGLVAQDVEKVIPEVVHTDSGGYKALSYDRLVPVLVEAIKEQQQIVVEHKKTIIELKTTITALTDRISKLEKLEARINRLEDKGLTARK
jgi:trimeric autotransporter adhesin